MIASGEGGQRLARIVRRAHLGLSRVIVLADLRDRRQRRRGFIIAAHVRRRLAKLLILVLQRTSGRLASQLPSQCVPPKGLRSEGTTTYNGLALHGV